MAQNWVIIGPTDSGIGRVRMWSPGIGNRICCLIQYPMDALVLLLPMYGLFCVSLLCIESDGFLSYRSGRQASYRLKWGTLSSVDFCVIVLQNRSRKPNISLLELDPCPSGHLFVRQAMACLACSLGSKVMEMNDQ